MTDISVMTEISDIKDGKSSETAPQWRAIGMKSASG
jgi:hypothetical protein